MFSLDAVAEFSLSLPDVVVGERYGNRTWLIGRKAIAWERPLTKADVKRFGDQLIPRDPILAVTVADLDDKEAVLAQGLRGVFSMSHFDGYAAVLVELRLARANEVRKLIVDGWLACAPERAVQEFLSTRTRTGKPSRR